MPKIVKEISTIETIKKEMIEEMISLYERRRKAVISPEEIEKINFFYDDRLKGKISGNSYLIILEFKYKDLDWLIKLKGEIFTSKEL